MKILFDILPIVLFFAAFKLYGIYAATITAIAATVLQIAWLKLTKRKVEPMQWASLVIIVIFGGATLWFKSEAFIKWKPSILYWFFAVSLLFYQFIIKKNIIKSMMGHLFNAPDHVWKKICLYWIGFFTLMGVINLYIAYQYSTDTWVNFKLFGGIGLMILFMSGQMFILSPYMINSDKES